MRTLAVLMLVMLVMFGYGTAAGQDSDLLAKAKQEAGHLALIQKNWGQKMGSVGATMTLKEVSRESVNGATGIKYHIFVTGMPKDKLYSLVAVSFDLRPVTYLQGITLDDSGMAICAGRPETCGDSSKPNDPVEPILLAAKGEPKRFGLISSDGQNKAFVSVTPFPIEGKDRGCSVDVTLLLAHGEAVLIHGAGFQSNATVNVVTQSENEKASGDLKSDSNGEVYYIELPYVKGKTDGQAQVTLTSQACAPSVSYKWGKNTYRMQ